MRAPTPSGARPPEPARQNVVLRYFARFDDAELARWCFRGLLAGALGVLAIDGHDLWMRNQWSAPAQNLPGVGAPAILPPAVETDGAGGSEDPRPFLPADGGALRQPLALTLEKGGVLLARGTIDPGAAERFRAEIEARGEYVRTVSLDSPGGSLSDAITMAKLVRERALATRVDDGALCASSCPLVMAGGATRSAGAKAAIGVHQFYAVAHAPGTGPGDPARAMADAQSTTAEISRFLAAMGVDPALWLHALDTPPRALYYLSAAEMAEYRLVTAPGAVAAGKS